MLYAFIVLFFLLKFPFQFYSNFNKKNEVKTAEVKFSKKKKKKGKKSSVLQLYSGILYLTGVLTEFQQFLCSLVQSKFLLGRVKKKFLQS